MISTPLVGHTRRLLTGSLTALVLATLGGCATPLWQTDAGASTGTLPPMVDDLVARPIISSPQVQVDAPIPGGASGASANGGSTTLADPLAGRLTSDTRAVLDRFLPTVAALLTNTSLGGITSGRAITLLAPTEAAFGRLPTEYVRTLQTDPSDADHVLARLILDGAYTYEQLTLLDSVLTIDGESLPVTHGWDGTVFVDRARVYPAVLIDQAKNQGRPLAVFPVDRVLLDGL